MEVASHEFPERRVMAFLRVLHAEAFSSVRNSEQKSAIVELLGDVSKRRIADLLVTFSCIIKAVRCIGWEGQSVGSRLDMNDERCFASKTVKVVVLPSAETSGQ